MSPPRPATGAHIPRRFTRAALAGALWLALAVPGSALAADGGPAPNVPVPATARVGAGTTPTTGAVTTPAGGAATGAGATAITIPRATTTAPAGTPSSGAVKPPLGVTGARSAGPRAAHRSSGTSGTAIALAAIAAVLVLCCAAWAAVRARGVEPHWTLALRHSMAEAAHRASATWAELGDWARLGR